VALRPRRRSRPDEAQPRVVGDAVPELEVEALRELARRRLQDLLGPQQQAREADIDAGLRLPPRRGLGADGHHVGRPELLGGKHPKAVVAVRDLVAQLGAGPYQAQAAPGLPGGAKGGQALEVLLATGPRGDVAGPEAGA